MDRKKILTLNAFLYLALLLPHYIEASPKIVLVNDGINTPRPAVRNTLSFNSQNLSSQADQITIGDLFSGSSQVMDNDRLSSNPSLQAIIQSSSAITSWNISIINSDSVVAAQEQDSPETLTATASILQSSPLASGLYSIVISARNLDGDTSSKTISNLKIENKLKVADALIGPNPFNPNQGTAAIDYQLTQNCDVALTILAINGRLIYRNEFQSGQNGGASGHNQVEWDGRDRYGDIVANGPYYIFIVAKEGRNSSTTKIKAMVLK